MKSGYFNLQHVLSREKKKKGVTALKILSRKKNN